MNICDEKKCIGCGICENVCNADACKLVFNTEGFLAPVVDDSKCVECNLCKSKCPALKELNHNSTQSAYAYYTSNEELRMQSSSGGFFTDVASHIINRWGGVAVGAAYSLSNDNPHYVKHIIIDNMNDLYKLRVSKYVQSDIRDALKQVKNYVDSGRVVLFSGTPCQISAVKSFVGDKENLYTIDLFCHGVPSPKVFYKYLQEMGAKKDTLIHFRDKTMGWGNSCVSFDAEGFRYVARHSQDTYYIGFVYDLYLRNSCHSCNYNRIRNRPADISIGDFWEIEKIMPELSDDAGISAVITNTIKGERLLETLKESKPGLCKTVDKNDVLLGNPILENPVKPHRNRNKFFKDFNATGKFLESARKNLNIGHNVLLLNHSFSHDNYGAMMVAYSMERIVEKFGYNPTTLLFKWPNHTEIFDSFKERYLHTTNEYSQGDYRELVKLNKVYDTFITGSDQVWRNWWHNDNLYRWFIDFANGSKNILSYAASFGLDYFDNTGVSNEKIGKLLTSYSGISVREKSGIDICKKCFNADAKLVIDPTQLLESDDYEKIIEGDRAEPPCKERYLVYMIFPEDENDTEKTYNFIDGLSKELNLKSVPIFDKERTGGGMTVGEWLSAIKNASFIVTESFHGAMFALIFKIPMLMLATGNSSRNRLPSFFEKIGCLRERILYNLDDKVAIKLAKEEIDWDEVYRRRKIFQDESLEFLRTTLAKQVTSNGRPISYEPLKLFIACGRKKISAIMPKPIKVFLKKIIRFSYILLGVQR